MEETNKLITPNPNIDPDSKEAIDQIMLRLKNIQPELRDYILGPSYANDFLTIIKTYNLATEYGEELEYITTMTLLGFIPPKEVRIELDQALPQISSSVRDGIYENVLKTILTKERMAVIERNWKEDDAIEQEIVDYIELSEVPKPTSLNKTTPEQNKPVYEIKPSSIITEEKLNQNIKKESSLNWDQKLEKQNFQISERNNIDASIPKVTQADKKVDMYREIPE